jgi:hypothetical protein
MTVRTGAAALRNPTTGTPAIEVGGQYNQGDDGLLGASPTDCGLLSGTPGAGAGKVADLDEVPGCGVAEAGAVDAQPTGNTAGLVPTPGTPAVPTACSAVTTFLPGTYDAAATDAVSLLTDGSDPNCRNRTFYFTPGVYSFLGTQLRFGDTGSFYVFGAASGWDPAGAGIQATPAVLADAGAALCDPAAAGTSLVLAGWTRVTHTGGRVAICPAWPAGATRAADAHPALYQQTIVPTGVQVTNINRSPAQNGINLIFQCRAPLIGVYPTQKDINSFNQCMPRRIYRLTLATDGRAPVRSLQVMLTANESDTTPNNLIRSRQSRFTVTDSAGTRLCQTSWTAGMPNGRLTSTFDLMALPGCASTPMTQDQLNGARIDVEHQMELTVWTVRQEFTLLGAQVEVNAATGLARSATSSDWLDVGNVTAVDSRAARPQMPAGCDDFVCAVADPGRAITPTTPFVHQMTLEDFEFAGLLNSSNPGVDPSLTTLRAVVRVRPSALTLPSSWTSAFGNLINTQNFLTPGTVRLELRSPAGGRCIVQGQGINSDQEIAFDLLDPNLDDPTATNCNTFIFENASELDDVTLSLRFELPCVPDYNLDPNGKRFCLRQFFENPTSSPALPVWQIRPPDIESVRLTTVTDTYSRAETSTVTVDATGGAASSSFHVFGRTWMPLADLDIRWNGPANAQPLFANDLVLHGMGSAMAAGAEMGTVCCDPPDSRTVELVAVIDGVERLTARVEFSDVRDVGGVAVYEPGYAVDVLRWLTCGREGCASVLAASDRRAGAPGP